MANLPLRTVLIDADKYAQVCDMVSQHKHRSLLLRSLLEASGLLNQVLVLPPTILPLQELMKFHTQPYLKALQRAPRQESIDPEDREAFGLEDECAGFVNVFEHAALIAGGTYVAVQSLIERTADVAINWGGGRHHAKKDSAAGFCWINDIVLGILKFLENGFQRVLYIDLDVHHGDGVEDAFLYSSKVFTVSIHHSSQGYFPGTGLLDQCGIGKGLNHCINIPLQQGATDETLTYVFDRIITAVKTVYRPDVCVLQLGADGLANDPLGKFNFTSNGLMHCLNSVLSWHIPILMLGGGGYVPLNVAKCWTELTAAAVRQPLPRDVPDHEYFPLYGPDFTIDIKPNGRPNDNTADYVQVVCGIIESRLAQLKESHDMDVT
eukprot:GILJ01014972.1.p1 GENE.GILJ01014972.1~~GILJ01014972.1.p1  ORF type:complete len:393 (+),score=39.86 GILJ01014972.1:45-1181(+)